MRSSLVARAATGDNRSSDMTVSSKTSAPGAMASRSAHSSGAWLLAIAARHKHHRATGNAAHERHVVTGAADDHRAAGKPSALRRSIAATSWSVGSQRRAVRRIRVTERRARHPRRRPHAPALTFDRHRRTFASSPDVVVRASIDQPARARHDIGGAGLDGQDADGGDEIVRALPRPAASATRRTETTVWAAATSASAAMPSASCRHDRPRPRTTISMRRMPTIEVTMPTSSARDSSTTPCSMCSSRNALMSCASSPRRSSRIAADPAKAVAQRLAARLGHIEHLRVQRARHAAAADAGQAIIAGLLGEKIDDFEGVVEPDCRIAQRARDFERRPQRRRCRRSGRRTAPYRYAIRSR